MTYDAATISIFPDIYHQFLPLQSDIVPVDDETPVHVDKDPNPYCRQLFEMLNSVNSPLFERFKNQTKMSIIGLLTNLKTDHCITEGYYDDICAIVNEVLSEQNLIINNFYETKNK